MQSAAIQPVSFTQIAVVVGAFGTLVTLIIGIYKLGGHATDLKNTKENLGRDVRGMKDEMRRGFQEVKEWRAEDKEARHEANLRVNEILADHETRITVMEQRS